MFSGRIIMFAPNLARPYSAAPPSDPIRPACGMSGFKIRQVLQNPSVHDDGFMSKEFSPSSDGSDCCSAGSEIEFFHDLVHDGDLFVPARGRGCSVPCHRTSLLWLLRHVVEIVLDRHHVASPPVEVMIL